MNKPALLLSVLVLVAGCGGSKAASPADQPIEEGLSEVVMQPQDTEPMTFSDIAPNDTAGVLSLMNRIMRDVDGTLSDLVPRDTTVPAGTGLYDREIHLWTSGDSPVKMVATEPNTTDRIFPETSVWFSGGTVAVVSNEEQLYFFNDGQLILMTDAAMEPVEITREEQSAIEISVIDSVKARLAIYGMKLP